MSSKTSNRRRAGGELNLAERLAEGLNGDSLLAADLPGLLLDRVRHEHLGAASSKGHARLLDGLREDRESVVQRALGLVDHLRRRSAENDGAGLPSCDARELDELRSKRRQRSGLMSTGKSWKDGCAGRTLSSPIMISSMRSQ